MISVEQSAEIRRLFYAEHWKVGTIAEAMGLHRDTVKRAINTESFLSSSASRPRPTRLDPYLPLVRQTLEQYPKLRATRLHQMLVERGYQGSVVQLRRAIRPLRPRAAGEAYLELRTLAGEQAQADWGSFGKWGKRRLSCFVMVLSWSRAIHAVFTLDQSMEIDPLTPSTLYAAANKVFKSTDGGVTWSAVDIPLSGGFAAVVAIDPLTPTTLYAGVSAKCGVYGDIVFHCTQSGVFKSTDAGVTWTATGLIDPADRGFKGDFPYLEIDALVIDAAAPDTLYVGTSNTGVFKSTDAGATWTGLNTGLPLDLLAAGVSALAIDPLAPSTLYAGTDQGVFSIQQVPVSCVGDCDGNGQGTIDELITLVNIALGNPGSCPNGVSPGTTVDIALIIQAVNNALSGCPSSDLYVAASGALSGDGTISNPYRRITDAVARARAERAAIPDGEIRIHVAPGTYVGSFDPAQLQQHPEYEVLPIILNVPQLSVLGATVLVRDDRSLPTAATPESETILEPDKSFKAAMGRAIRRM